MAREFRLPELGENIESGDVVRVLVSEGDTVREEQTVLELETEKATIEVPVPFGGRVSKIHIKEGDKVKVGQPILTLEETGDRAAAEPTGATAPSAPAPEASAKKTARVDEPTPRPSPPPEPPTIKPPDERPPVTVRRPPHEKVVAFERRSARAPEPEPTRTLAPAAPSVRRLARELGVQISEVPGSGPDGRISLDDVKHYVRSLSIGTRGPPAAPPTAAGGIRTARLPDFGRWGEIERQPMSGIRRKTAEHLSYAWSTIPQVTQHDSADITGFEELRQRFSSRTEASGVKLTITALALQVVAAALKAFPQFAASVDMEREEIIYKKYYHVGVAVDTDRGLLVPVIRDVDKKNILELAQELSQLADKARNRKLTLEEMEGGTFSITNLGGIGGTYFSPIVNHPEVAILGLSRASPEPVLQEGVFVPRLRLPLSLSYDHRVIDGADAARFLRWIRETLEQPLLLSLEE